MMRSRCKTGAEKAWIVASLTALALHRLLAVEPQSELVWLIQGAMIALSFPFGLIAMLFIIMLIEGPGGDTNFSWLIDWSTLLLIGYIQWFWVLPEMRRDRQALTLNLTSVIKTSTVETSTVETSTVEASPVETISVKASPVETLSSAQPPFDSPTFPERAPVVSNVAAFVPSRAEFDEAGLTALERVLRA